MQRLAYSIFREAIRRFDKVFVQELRILNPYSESRKALKALILAGGFGTRLRPLSCTRPKLLFPIANKPLLDLTLERLAAHGVDEAILAVNFMAEVLERAYGKSKHGIKLYYSRDAPAQLRAATPSAQGALGTGGPVKQAQRLLENGEPFFVLNGDILTDIDYTGIKREHEKNGGTATIALHRVKNPRRYGVVEITKQRQITKFTEKPKGATGSLINAGIYVFQSAIFSHIPADKRCSLEREVFPRLAEEGKLFGYEAEGLWVDVGKPADYLQANRLWLQAGMDAEGCLKTRLSRQVKEAVVLGENVYLGKESAVGPNVSLGRGVYIGEGVSIRDSIVFPHTTILDYALVEGAMIGESVTVGRKVRIGRGCLVGDNVVIKDGVKLAHNVKVCPFKEVSENVNIPGTVM
jgi:mannose-1-phosphate guanylyltransferase